MTVYEFAKKVNAFPQQVYGWCHAGRIPANRKDGFWEIDNNAERPARLRPGRKTEVKDGN